MAASILSVCRAFSSAEGTEKSVKVTVYYTEEAGHRVAHFFRRAV
jgi:hypothetical protein